MSGNSRLVIADEWTVVLFADATASARSVRRWRRLSRDRLAGAVAAVERQLPAGGWRQHPRLMLGSPGEVAWSIGRPEPP